MVHLNICLSKIAIAVRNREAALSCAIS